MRVLVCGSRDASPTEVEYLLDTLLGSLFGENVTAIIHGAAQGADLGAEMLRCTLGLEPCTFPADWNRHGKAAGPIRNAQMLEEGNPDIVIAFWDGKSKGTLDMITKSIRADLRVIVEPAPIPPDPQEELFDERS